ncbi:MAG: Hsp20/alpha crystallin family protein [Candidatus Binatia bacterium]
MRALIPWNPYQGLMSWHNDIDDIFNRFFSPTETERWFPPAETFSKDGRQIVRLDLPGVDPKNVEVSVVDDTLIIKGERKSSDEVKEKHYHYRETSYGKFERRLALPKGVDGEKIKASYKNGVLEISVPLPVKLAGRKIPIEDSQTRNLSAA